MLVMFKPTANVPADIRNRTWIVARTGIAKGRPAARLIGADAQGRDRCFMADLDALEIVGR